ncbi:hypothetical protein [Kaistia sp. MMO-174]|uniref:hypothetical protein n=1 Tax=Kaistia sp. MMO-174 TaxID=3081256 RepID=UPI00301905C2
MRRLVISAVAATFLAGCVFHAVTAFGGSATAATIASIFAAVFTFILAGCELALSDEEKP